MTTDTEFPGSWKPLTRTHWHRITSRLWVSEDIGGTIYNVVRGFNGNWRVEDSHGGVWGKFDTELQAMLAVENGK